MKPNEILPLFDEHVESEGGKFEAVVIRGGALSLMGLIPRMTSDFDVLDPDILKSILKLALSFRKQVASQGIRLDEEWLNNGPKEIKHRLPKNWRNRTQKIFEGKAITFHTLGRSDLIKTKLDACCIRVQPDLDDLIALKPTRGEFSEASEWVLAQDAGGDWPRIVSEATSHIAERLGYEL